MAQNVFINVTLSAASATHDKAVHTIVGGSAPAGDVTFAYDSAKLTTMLQVDTVWAAIRTRLAGAGFK
jgi:hypothetical protein